MLNKVLGYLKMGGHATGEAAKRGVEPKPKRTRLGRKRRWWQR